MSIAYNLQKRYLRLLEKDYFDDRLRKINVVILKLPLIIQEIRWFSSENKENEIYFQVL